MESSICRQKKLFETEKTGDEVSAGAGNFELDPALGAALLAHAAAVVVVVEEPFSVSSISSALQFTSTYDIYFLKESLFSRKWHGFISEKSWNNIIRIFIVTQQRQQIITIISINIIVIIFNRINNLKRICHGVEKGKLLGLAKTNIGSVSMFVPNFYTEIFDNKSCFLVFFPQKWTKRKRATIHLLE